MAIKLLNDITVFNSITAISGLHTGDLVATGSINNPEFNQVKQTSAHWDEAYTYVQNNSGSSGGSDVSTISAKWDDSSNIVISSSANWNEAFTYVLNNSANETSQQSNSANWNNVFTSVNSNSAAWLSATTQVIGSSANWNNVFTSVNSNSAAWLSATTIVISKSANWDRAYTITAQYSATSANPNLNTLTVSNSANIGTLALGASIIPDNSKLYVIGNVNISGNLSANGTISFSNTNFTTTSALCVVNNGTGPTIVAYQTGDQPIVAFYDGEHNTYPAFWVDGANARPGFVGIGTSTPNTNLAVVGNVSASGGLSASSLTAPHKHLASDVTDLSSAISEQIIIYSYLFS